MLPTAPVVVLYLLPIAAPPHPSAGHASTAYAAAKFETQSHYNKCTVQVQCNVPSQQGPSAGHASTAYAAAKFEISYLSAICLPTKG